MTGAEQDRHEDRAVDQDREAERVTQRAGESNALHRLFREQEQSPWIDFIDRELLESGKLEQMVADGIRGLTSNPTIFAKAVATGQYDELIRREIGEGNDAGQIYQRIAVTDVGGAADVLRRVYDASNGTDGFASIEVEPDLASDTDATLARARELWARLDRPNIFIKIPATEAGIPAVEGAIGAGINVNVTLMFSVEVYERVARAYIAGLRALHARGADLSRVASVASFFVSRVDTKVDKQLDDLGTPEALGARGRAAIANAKLAYESYQRIFGGDEFADLRAAGAQVQRCLWASTSTKNPEFRDVLYVEELIGPETVDTMPLETITAFLDHGDVRRTLDRDVSDAHQAIREIEAQGISMQQVTDELIAEGVASFAKSFDELIE
ncbi:MAG: transaldolase, partial [Chloroflexi bacterium]|nr:transaldolase [Chloroflexota bacterium]